MKLWTFASVNLAKVVKINDIRFPNDLMDENAKRKVDPTKKQKRTSCILERGAKHLDENF